MHVLHRPERRSVLLITALAAALAIIVSLALATSLSGVNFGASSSGSRAGVASRPAPARVTRPSSLLTGNSLTGPLGAPIRMPWTSAGPFGPPVH